MPRKTEEQNKTSRNIHWEGFLQEEVKDCLICELPFCTNCFKYKEWFSEKSRNAPKRDKAIEMMSVGVPLTEIAEAMNCPLPTLSAWKKYAVSNGKLMPKKDQIIEAFLEGWSIKRIAEHFDVAETTVYRWEKIYGFVFQRRLIPDDK